MVALWGRCKGAVICGLRVMMWVGIALELLLMLMITRIMWMQLGLLLQHINVISGNKLMMLIVVLVTDDGIRSTQLAGAGCLFVAAVLVCVINVQVIDAFRQRHCITAIFISRSFTGKI